MFYFTCDRPLTATAHEYKENTYENTHNSSGGFFLFLLQLLLILGQLSFSGLDLTHQSVTLLLQLEIVILQLQPYMQNDAQFGPDTQ